MNEFNTTPVKSPINPNALIGSNESTPQHYVARDEDGEEMLVGSFSAMKVTQGGNLSKRCADSFTIEGSPVNVNNRFKRQDIHPTPLKASFYGGQDFDDTPLPRVPIASTAIPVNNTTHVTSATVKVESTANTTTNTSTAKLATEPERLLVICSASEEHNTGDHQENALRTALLCGAEGCLRRPEVNNHIRWIDSDNLTAAPLTDLLRVHEYTYLRYIEDKCKAAATAPHPSSAQGGGGQLFPSFYAPPGMLDSDTPLQPQSLEAAKRFCGAAILAVDHVMAGRREAPSGDTNHPTEQQGECARAFVIGRPPGHHAGPHGCVPSAYFWQRPDMASSGFCLLNTVAVAAAYARHQYGRWAWRNVCLSNNPITTTSTGANSKSATTSGGNGCVSGVSGKGEWRAPRIAIVDIDIHHGNGTEEIVRNLSPRSVHLPLPSSWAPVSTLSYKPWLNEQDEEEVFFSSVHLYAGDRFYPCSGPDSHPDTTTTTTTTTPITNTTTPPTYNTTSNPAAPASERIVNIALTPIGPGPWDRKGRAKLTPAQKEVLCKQASAEFRSKVASMLLPRLLTFNPDLLFISAGFDAHHDDYYHFLTEADLHWVTEELCKVADRCGGGSGGGGTSGAGRRCGVISVLEGGYSLSSPIPKATKPARALAVGSGSGVGADSAGSAGSAGGVGSGVDRSSVSATHAVDPAVSAAATVTSPVAPVSAADAALGRGGRGKAKKTTSTGATAAVALPAVVVPVVAVASTGGVGSAVSSPELKAPHTSTGVSAGVYTHAQEETMYAQRPGDGGLVKGVLAHAAALSGRKAWVVRNV